MIEGNGAAAPAAVPDYAPCRIELEFGDGEYTFQLRLVQIAELQRKCDAGIATIWGRVAGQSYHAEDLVETVRLGLIGGGMDAVKAKRLVATYTDEWPMEKWWSHAFAILAACVVGYQPPEEEQPADAEKKTVTAASASPAPTETGTP